MQKLTLKGIFFDLMDTLVVHDSMPWPLFIRIMKDCLVQYGLSSSTTIFEIMFDQYFQGAPPRDVGNDSTIFERRIKLFCLALGLALKDEDIKNTAESIIRAWKPHLMLAPDCHKVLNILGQDKTLALVSNFDHPPAIRQVIHDMGLGKYFSTIIISGEVGCQKPDPAIFNLALQKTGLLAEQVLHVGDSEDDVNGAVSAGILPIHLKRPGIGFYEKPNDIPGIKVISELRELLEIID